MTNISTDISTDWVRETRIGTWFLGSSMWRHHVLPGTMADLLQLLPASYTGGRILDICCGQGFALPFLDRQFHPESLLGLDIDPDLVAKGAAITAQCSCPAEIRVGDATRIDLPDQSVDTIFCHQSFHHLAEQTKAAEEFFRVLVPGGRLLFTESCRSFIFSWWVRLFFRHPMEAQKSADEYIALLQRAGFSMSETDVLLPNPPWARTDFGLLEAIGYPVKEPGSAPIVCLVAHKSV